MVELPDLEPLDLPQRAAHPMTGVRRPGGGAGVIPARYPLPASSYRIRPFRCRFAECRLKLADCGYPNSCDIPFPMEPNPPSTSAGVTSIFKWNSVPKGGG
jgi:hypothetical protein